MSRKLKKELRGWELWFAWKPVTLTNEKRAWGKKVWRRKILLENEQVEWQYAEPKSSW